MKLKLDLHVHTNRSSDAFTSPKQLTTICRDRRLDGLAITDHNVLAVDSSDEPVILPGIEISTRHGHVIGLGVSEAVPRGLSADETIRRIRDLNGVSIIPHPYDLLRSSVRPHLLTVRPDIIEVINSSSFLHSVTWKRARKFAEKEKYPMTAVESRTKIRRKRKVSYDGRQRLPHSPDNRKSLHRGRMWIEGC